VDPVLKGSNLGNVGVGSIDGILPGLVMAKEAGYEIHLYSTDECREKNSGLIEVSSEARKAIRAALNP
jgi:PDZ domain-containing secreted protein